MMISAGYKSDRRRDPISNACFGQIFCKYIYMWIPPLMLSPIAQSVAFADLKTEVAGSIPAPPIFFPRIADSHCDRIHSSLTAVRCFDNGYVGKQAASS